MGWPWVSPALAQKASANADGDSITIQFKLKPKENTFVLFNNEDEIEFANTTNKDTLITRRVWSNKPKEFRYGRANKSGHYVHHFVMHPNSTAVFELTNGIDIQPVGAPKKAVFLDYWFGFKYNFVHIKLRKEKPASYYAKINKFNSNNSKLIDSLYNSQTIDLQTRNNWTLYRTMEYYTAYMYYFNQNNFQALYKLYGKKADSISNNYKNLIAASDFGMDDLFYYSCRYEMLKQHKNIENVNEYILYLIASRDKFGYETVMDEAYNMIKNYSKVSDPNFKLAYNNLLKFAITRKDKYEALIRQINQSDFAAYGEVRLININKEELSLKDIANESGHLLFIDLWASWCKPCREQMPVLEQYKLKNKKPIRFITVNIDEEDKPELWLNALKDDGLYASKDQYQLKDKANSPLIKFFNVTSIPRYIILDNKGRVINSFFYPPNDDSFEEELNKLLK